jgi:hypothetical protein
VSRSRVSRNLIENPLDGIGEIIGTIGNTVDGGEAGPAPEFPIIAQGRKRNKEAEMELSAKIFGGNLIKFIFGDPGGVSKNQELVYKIVQADAVEDISLAQTCVTILQMMLKMLQVAATRKTQLQSLILIKWCLGKRSAAEEHPFHFGSARA